MCLYIPITAKPTVLSEPLRVYKLLLPDNTSLFRRFKYHKNRKVSVNISKIKPEDTNPGRKYSLYPEGYMPVPFEIDHIAQKSLHRYIIENSLYYKDKLDSFPPFIRKNSLLQIDSGLHFFYTLDRLKKYMKECCLVASKVGEFEIPVGSTVYTGIDETLGVTNCIVLKKTFKVDMFKLSLLQNK